MWSNRLNWILGTLLCCYITLPAIANPKKEKLLISGCGWKEIAIIDKASGDKEWSHPLLPTDDCNDVEITSQGNILYAYRGGARLITREHQTLWDYKVKPKEELYTATQLKSGNYMLAMCGNPARLLLLDKAGKLLKEQSFDSNIKGIHSQFRQIAKTAQDTYLIPLMGKGCVLELDNELRVIKSIPTGGNPFSVKVLDNGNWLVSCGDAHKLVEVDPTKEQVVKTISSDDIADAKLLFVAEAIRSSDGNTMIANWNGHSKDKSQPLLLEVNSSNQLVWSLPLRKDIKNISSVYRFYE
jgi:hypothetical protein